MDWGNLDNSGPVDLDDLLCELKAFSRDFPFCTRYASDLASQVPTGLIDLIDILALLGALANDPYPYALPCP